MNSSEYNECLLCVWVCASLCVCIFNCVRASFDECLVWYTFHTDESCIEAGPLTLYAIICDKAKSKAKKWTIEQNDGIWAETACNLIHPFDRKTSLLAKAINKCQNIDGNEFLSIFVFIGCFKVINLFSANSRRKMTTLRPFTCSDMFKFNNVLVYIAKLYNTVQHIYFFTNRYKILLFYLFAGIWIPLLKLMDYHFICNTWHIGQNIFK